MTGRVNAAARREIETAAVLDGEGRQIAMLINVPKTGSTEAWAADVGAAILLALMGAKGHA